ncbi:arsenate reductase, putative [Cordyceps militaris CM01]|uniref:Arsenate reductase, putative n=2 Tax=Cordyceps militaris TaxID=73501 RepID=G3J786_CORMM|nr:arsenate reductase, putative [Cordyceps militaris CM01]ATY61667.1 arsenate reductase, putative [Cordyceps militaris]EGX95459.1 arsenate reductase, putative [Cordyceps militaris CM01]
MSTEANAPPLGETPPWWATLPEPQATCETIENSEVMPLLEKILSGPKHAKRDFLLVDVRRNDWDGGTVATSINLPAQSFFQTRPVVYQLCKQAGIEKIIFYCGSSAGRGTRSARWMQDYLNEVGETDIKAIIMTGGIKGWHKSFGGKLMENYDEKSWATQG